MTQCALRVRCKMMTQNGQLSRVYYAMFHIARALIFKQGYREKSHRCLVIAIQELYVDKGKLPVEYLDSFREAMDLRESADYGFIYSKDSANSIIKSASEFYEYAKQLLPKP